MVDFVKKKFKKNREKLRKMWKKVENLPLINSFFVFRGLFSINNVSYQRISVAVNRKA